MPDLVSENRRQLGFGAHVVEHAARDEDEAAGEREGVGRRVIDHAEGPRQVRALRVLGEIGADPLHVVLQRLVLHEADGLRDLLRGLLSQLNFLLFGDERELALARDGIRGAGGDRRRARHEHPPARPARNGRDHVLSNRSESSVPTSGIVLVVGGGSEPASQLLGHAPGLRDAAARRVGRLGVEDLRDGPHPEVVEVAGEPGEKAARADAVVGMHLEPGVHPRANEPPPHRALVVGCVARSQVAVVPGLVLG